MSEFSFELVRQAIATKARSVSGIRSSNTNLEVLTPRPALRLSPNIEYELRSEPNGQLDRYTLTVTGEVVVDRPGGKKLSGPVITSLMRGLQLEWRSGMHLGLLGTYDSSTVSSCRSSLESMTPGLSEFVDTGADGFQAVWKIDIDEVFTTNRVV